MATELHLSGKAFVLTLVAELIAVFAISTPIVLLISLAAFGSVFALFVIDKKSLRIVKPNSLVCYLDPKDVYLEDTVKFCCTMSAVNDSAAMDDVTLIAPKSRLLNFLTKKADFKKHATKPFVRESTLVARANRLGYEELEVVKLEKKSTFGFWVASYELNLTTALKYRTSPELNKISAPAFSRLISKQRTVMQGSWRSISVGNDQFYSIRPYQYPDSLRHIDHKKTARYGKLMTRLYDHEPNHHLVIALDLGRAMCGMSGDSPKLDYYLSACLKLGEAALRQQDKVSFIAFGSEEKYSFSKTNTIQSFNPIFRGDKRLTPRAEYSNFALLDKYLTRTAGQRSIVTIFTDSLAPSTQESILKQLAPLYRKHMVIIVSMEEDSYNLNEIVKSAELKNANDCVELLYSYWLNDLYSSFDARINNLGGSTLLIPKKYWLSATDLLYSKVRNLVAA